MNDSLPALSEAFSPPGSLVGVASLMTAMSADAPLLETLMEALTGEGSSQRSARGTLTTALFLDAAEPLLEPEAVPGLYQVPPGNRSLWRSSEKTLLLHSKLAILGFAKSPAARLSALRLVIYTGNWTLQSASRDIDLIWWTDLDLTIAKLDAQTEADIAAAYHFILDVQRYFEPLPPARRIKELKDVLGNLRSRRKSRVVSTLKYPLVEQVARRLTRGHDGKVTQLNWLTIGSGFFEQETKSARLPRFLATLPTKISGLTSQASKQVVFNPNQAGALAGWWNSGPTKRAGWKGFLPTDPADANRGFMHAKFIFVGRRSKTGFSKARLYLGSGNLSLAGFFSSPSQPFAKKANIEIGVVLNFDDDATKSFETLPIGDEHSKLKISPGAPGDENEPRDYILPPPILYVEVHAGQELGLAWSSQPSACQLSFGDDQWLDVAPNTTRLAISIALTLSSTVRVRRTEANSPLHSIPVIGADESFCRTPPSALILEEIVDAVVSFPTIPEPVDPDTGPADDEVDSNKHAPSYATSRSTSEAAERQYPAFLAMQLIETIADRNNRIQQDEYDAWIRHLRDVLVERAHPTTREVVRTLRANIFACLNERHFKPPSLSSSQRKAYGRLIHDVGITWEIAQFEPLLAEAAHG